MFQATRRRLALWFDSTTNHLWDTVKLQAILALEINENILEINAKNMRLYVKQLVTAIQLLAAVN
ncbi:MAG: hypothetical protein V7L23_27060 [Nostoc sp.]|uniref:hypothetical protein n=1 Tax=Nostoc sp. TaxID=1180 RepID=UPI002FF1C541